MISFGEKLNGHKLFKAGINYMNVCFVDPVFFPMMIRMAHNETTTHVYTQGPIWTRLILPIVSHHNPFNSIMPFSIHKPIAPISG